VIVMRHGGSGVLREFAVIEPDDSDGAALGTVLFYRNRLPAAVARRVAAGHERGARV